MTGEYRGNAIQCAVRYRRSRTAASFLGRLKDQAYRAARRNFLEQMRRADKHRHVGAVATGMHAPGINRRVRRAGRFVSWQGIHFGA